MVDAEVFQTGMRLFASGVTLVMSGMGNRRAGLTATAVCSLSADPPRLLACVNRFGGTYAMISESRCFSVNMLAVQHETLAGRFAGRQSAGADDGFEGVKWDVGFTGAPLLHDALACFDCRVSAVIDVVSHCLALPLLGVSAQTPFLSDEQTLEKAAADPRLLLATRQERDVPKLKHPQGVAKPLPAAVLG